MAKTNTSRRFPGTSNRNRPDKSETRQAEAAGRQEFSDSLSPQKRLENLDIKFGPGKGAAKERKKLLARLEKTGQATANVETLATQTLPDEVMLEISAINEEASSKKKTKAKDRRARDQQKN